MFLARFRATRFPCLTTRHSASRTFPTRSCPRRIEHLTHSIGTHDRKAALAGLRYCEVLVLSGDSDRLTPFSHAEVIAAELPDAELVRAEGAGHVVMLEQPELVTSHLIGLIRRACARLGGEQGAVGTS